MEIRNLDVKQRLRSSCICRVCGDVARGINYNVITCMPCKMFFQRNALRAKGTLRCARRFNCEITITSRAVCSACRLKKCFALGMKAQLIRSQLPTHQPLALLQNDRSTLTTEQWNVLSNIVHAYDEQNCVQRIKYLLDASSSLPVKLRTKSTFALELLQQSIVSFEPIIKRSSHFQSLSIDARRVLIPRNTLSTTFICNILMSRQVNYLIDSNFVMSFSGTHGSQFLTKLINIIERMDSNETILKIMMFVIAFSSNTSIVTFDSADNIETMSFSINFIRIQDMYVTTLWKYLVYQYGFEEAVRRYCSLIKIILDLYWMTEKFRSIEVYDKMVDMSVKQIEHSLILEE